MFLLARMQQRLMSYAKMRVGSRLGMVPEKTPEAWLEIERLYVLEDWSGTSLGGRCPHAPSHREARSITAVATRNNPVATAARPLAYYKGMPIYCSQQWLPVL